MKRSWREKRKKGRQRNKKCENALSEHFKKLQSENGREAKAIRQYFLHKIYKTENFRI